MNATEVAGLVCMWASGFVAGVTVCLGALGIRKALRRQPQ